MAETASNIAVILPPESETCAAVVNHYGLNGSQVVLPEESDWEQHTDTRFDLIFVDWRVAFAHDFIAKIKLARLTNRTPVIAIYAAELPPSAYPHVTFMPDEELVEPVSSQALVASADRLLQQRRARPRHFAQEISWRFATSPDEIEKVHDLFDELLVLLGFDEMAQVTFGHSFKEALGNAAEHGNGNDPAKQLRVVTLVDHEKFICGVTDQGAGFDHSNYLSKAASESAYETTTGRRKTESRPGGLGVHMMLKACDSISFAHPGNTIFLMKYLPGKEPAEDNGTS